MTTRRFIIVTRIVAAVFMLVIAFSIYSLLQMFRPEPLVIPPTEVGTPSPTPSEALRSPLPGQTRDTSVPDTGPSTTRQEDPPPRVVVVPQPVPGPAGEDGEDGEDAPPLPPPQPQPSPSPTEDEIVCVLKVCPL